jgi:hypothetical protein
MSLSHAFDKYMAEKEKACTHIMVINNVGGQNAEAILEMPPEVLKFMRQVWADRYYNREQK